MDEQDIRWKRRFENYKKALVQLGHFMNLKEFSEMEEQGLIKCFEYNYELAWNLLRDYLRAMANPARLVGSKDTFRVAHNEGLISDGVVWMNMVKARNSSVHAYNESVAAEIAFQIRATFYEHFLDLQKTFTEISEENE